MSSNPKFFTDPKVAISIFALLIAIGSLLWSMFSSWEQNRRWDALNLGSVEIIDVGFIMWKEITREEAFSTNWGYKPTIFSHTENRMHTGKYRLSYELILVDPNTKNRIPNSNGFFTIEEAQKEISRLGIKQEPLPEPWKHFQIQFDFKNMGSTIASEILVQVKMKEWRKNNWLEIFKSNHGVNLAPSATCNSIVDFRVPITSSFPDEINFEVAFSYFNVHGETIRRNIPVTYDSTKNYWSYGK